MKSNHVKRDREVEDPGLAGAVSRGKSALMTKSIRGLHAFVIASVAAFLLFCGSLGKAQTFRGTILGTVTDSSGLAVADATVTVKNIDTGLVRATQTSADGSYTVTELPIGTYTVTISQAGFARQFEIYEQMAVCLQSAPLLPRAVFFLVLIEFFFLFIFCAGDVLDSIQFFV